jgi:hypothetical protein
MPKVIFAPSEGYWNNAHGWVGRPDQATPFGDWDNTENITIPAARKHDAILVPAERCSHLELYDVCKMLKLSEDELQTLTPAQLSARFRAYHKGDLYEDGEGGFYCLESSEVFVLPSPNVPRASGVYEGPDADPYEPDLEAGLLPRETTALQDATDIAGLVGAFMRKHGARLTLDLMSQCTTTAMDRLGKNYHKATLATGEHIDIQRSKEQ